MPQIHALAPALSCLATTLHALDRVEAEADLLAFTHLIFKKHYGQTFKEGSHHRQIADTLMEVARGTCPRLIINVPPRYGKTELAVRLFMAWSLTLNPKARFLHLSYSDDLALENSAATRDVLRSDGFQRLWPVKLKDDARSKKKWSTVEGGGIYAASAGGAVTGFGAGATTPDYDANGRVLFGGAVIIDDPLKPEDAFSEPIRSRVNRRFHSTILSRLNSRETPIVLIMQRLHEQDLAGYLSDQEAEDWRVLKLPALDEGSSEPLWPARHTAAELKRIEQGDPYAFAAQYQQQPVRLGGAIFKEHWWQFYQLPPVNLVWRAIYADTAQKTGEANDFSVFQCWGMSQDGKAYLLDLCRGKWEAPELERQATAFWNKHKTQDPRFPAPLRKFVVEDKVSGTGLLQKLQRDGLPIEGLQRARDKTTRAMDVVGYVAAGQVVLPAGSPWLSDFLAEMSQFPQGRHDDQVDPALDAMADMLGGGQSLYDLL